MSSCQLMFPGFRSFLEFSSFGLSLLPLAFSLILAVVSRFLHPYSTGDKNNYFNGEKIFQSEGHPESFTELHGKEKRKEGG